MKKSLLFISTLFAAGTLVANAATVQLINLPSDNDFGWLTQGNLKSSGWLETFGTTSISASDVKTNLGVDSALLTTGWHSQVANHNASGDTYNTTKYISSTSFSLMGRSGFGGMFVMETISVSDLLTASKISNPTKITDISVSFDVADSGNKLSNFSFALFSYSGGSVTQLGTTQTGTSSVDLSVSNLSLSKDDKIFAIFGGNSGATTFTISNLSSSATVIPEPSLFGLFAGTLALGLAGTRRRRGNAKK